MVMEGDLTWGGEHTTPYTGDGVLQNCTTETYIITLPMSTQNIQLKKKKS